jgi:hypothetical protein
MTATSWSATVFRRFAENASILPSALDYDPDLRAAEHRRTPKRKRNRRKAKLCFAVALSLRRLRVGYKLKPGATIKFSAVEFAAAIQTGDRSFNSAHSRKLLSAARAGVKEATRAPLNRKWQGMSSRLVPNSQVPACFPPFDSMRGDAATAGSELGKQMSQLVSQGAVDLRCIMFVQAGIQRDALATKICAPRGTEKSRIPFHLHRSREF